MPVVTKTTVRLYPPDIEVIDRWAAANPDPDTGLTPSRPTAIRRMIRSMKATADPRSSECALPATRADVNDAVTRLLDHLNATIQPQHPG